MGKKIPFNILICPECSSENLTIERETMTCENCKSNYRYINDTFQFSNFKTENISDSLDRIKHFIKNYSKLYNFLIYLISPVYSSRKKLDSFLADFVTNKEVTAINLGSGNSDISDNVSNVDIFAYENVDLTCNIEKLPFRDQSIDVIINIAVLEHVPQPEKVVKEIYRVLKRDGMIYLHFPFIQGFHASPYDFSRRTVEGIKHLLGDFEVIDIFIAGGPTSGFLWIFQEWVAILLSFGIKPLYTLVFLAMMILTFPLKFLDIVLQHHPMAKNIASGFIFTGTKK